MGDAANESAMNDCWETQALCIEGLLRTKAERIPDAIAITAPGRMPLVYGRLCSHVAEVASSLNAIGVGRNDRVAIVAPNGPEMAVAFLCVAACATCAPLNPGYRASEFEFYLSDLKVKALIVQSGIDSPAIAVAHECGLPVVELSPRREAHTGIFSVTSPETPTPFRSGFAQAGDVALILHTSGTTSVPKMVPLTHCNILSSARNTVAALQLNENDRCLNMMPLFH